MNELGLEDEFVSDRLGTTHRAIDVFRTGEFQGTHNERLRIIKLLEGKLCPCVESDSFPSPDDDREEIMKHMNCSWDAMMIEYHVALIKGEQK